MAGGVSGQGGVCPGGCLPGGRCCRNNVADDNNNIIVEQRHLKVLDFGRRLDGASCGHLVLTSYKINGKKF